MIQILHNIQNVQEGKKTSEKRDIKLLSFRICEVTNLPAPSFVPSGFGDKFPTTEFWMISAETPCCEIERK
jgi:hypothetical protein